MTRQLLVTLAAISTGMSAGIYAAYALAVMPGLKSVDDATFVSSFAAIDRAIVSPVFLVGIFLGSPVALLAVCLRGSVDRPSLAWAAFGLAVASVVVTVAVNVPLNDALKAAASSPAFDPATVRAAFHEGRWVAANLVRLAMDCAALALLTLAIRR